VIILEPITIPEPDLVVGLTFCAIADPSKYTISHVVKSEYGVEYILKKESGDIVFGNVDDGYLYLYGEHCIDLGWDHGCHSTKTDDEYHLKRYIFDNHPHRIKIC
jgi:hypothetical protein